MPSNDDNPSSSSSYLLNVDSYNAAAATAPSRTNHTALLGTSNSNSISNGRRSASSSHLGSTSSLNAASSAMGRNGNGSSSSSSSSSSGGHSTTRASSNGGEKYNPPRRLPGASLPSSSAVSVQRSTEFPTSSSTSLSSHTSPILSSLHLRRVATILRLSYEGIRQLLYLLHPAKWSISAHLTDQASAALICYKLYALSITVPPTSKLYFYYLPSCILSDLLAICILQCGYWLAWSKKEYTPLDADEVERHDANSAATVGGGRRAAAGSSTGLFDSFKEKIASLASKPNRLLESYGYTPLQTQSPTRTLESGHSPRSAVVSPYTPPSTSTAYGAGSTAWHARGPEEDSPTAHLHVHRNADEDAAEKAEIVGGGGERHDAYDNDKEELEENDHEYAPLVTASRTSEDSPSHVLFDEYNARKNNKRMKSNTAAGSEATRQRRYSAKMIAKAAFWLTFRSLLIVACLVAIVFTVIAIGAYSAGRVVFSWQGAFDSSSQSGYLLGYAFTEFPHFLLAYLSIFSIGTAITLSRYWLPHLVEAEDSSSSVIRKIVPSGKKRYALIGISIIGFLAVCAAVRPPRALPATDLLIDGVTATSAILLFSGGSHTHPPALNQNTTIYGHSNAFQQRVTPLDSDKIEHVFFIFLESADELAWPYQPDKFCKHRNCEDISEEYNKVEHFTPFFNSLITQDPHSIYINDFRTNLAYTIKAHLASMCGVMPHIHDYISSEAEMTPPTACIPHILKTINPEKWKTGWFQAQMTAYDRQHEVIEKEGFDTIYDSNTMTSKFGHKKEWTNYFGYSDEELHPMIWDWVDERLNKSESVFMTTAGSTMHHPFSVSPWTPKVEYTKTQWTNDYLNVVRQTDKDLGIFFDNLKSRNLLDKSLIVIQGDHGPRIGEDGIYVDYGWWEHIYRAPLLIRAPGLLPKRIEQDPLRPFIALDIAPTILDALGVSPNILKNFVGQSIFRARGTRQVRDSYHAQSRGGQYPHVLRLEKKNGYKGVRWDNGDTCATDIRIDPSETYFYCVNEGWRKVFEDEVMTDGLIKGLWIEGSSDEKKLIEYAHEAKKQLDIHLEINADFWDTSKHKEEYAEEKIKFLQTVKEQAHWM